jgi:deazaflavin-dependent oxidoreductase (nitroreductase family)
VTTRGAKSGKLRKNPVMRVTDGSAYPLVASKSGSDEQPQWHNLKADPDAVELKKDHLGQDERDDHDRPELRHTFTAGLAVPVLRPGRGRRRHQRGGPGSAPFEAARVR